MSANVCTSWWHKDFPPPFKSPKWFPNHVINQCFTYYGVHPLHIRTENPLPQVIYFKHLFLDIKLQLINCKSIGVIT